MPAIITVRPLRRTGIIRRPRWGFTVRVATTAAVAPAAGQLQARRLPEWQWARLWLRLTPALLQPMLTPPGQPLRMRTTPLLPPTLTTQAWRPVRRAPPIPWEKSSRLYHPAAHHPRWAALPTICAATPGSSHLMARTASTTALCLLPRTRRSSYPEKAKELLSQIRKG